jgi:imidazoleglycerol-phosphate dehydratase/histidinol-phosphatase
MKVGTGNAHHQVEGLFKAFARAVRQAIHRNPYSDELPSTKGVL